MSKEFISALRCNVNCILDKSDEFKCQICNQLMINPSYTPCCCEFCYHCISEYIINESDKCPGSSENCLTRSITINDIKLSPVTESKISKLKVKCLNKKCNEEDELSKIIQHFSICDKSGLRCPLYQYGCDVEVEDENELKDHMMEQQERHLSNLISLIEELKNQVNRSEININRNMNTENKLLQHKISLLEKENEESRRNIADLKLKYEDLEKRTASPVMITDEMKKSINNEFENRFKEEMRKSMNENLRKIEEMPIEVEMRIKFCPLIWIVENWKQNFDNKSNVDKLIGPTFYSKSGEYKWRVGIIFDFNCVKFFGQILKGEFDDGLEWPCKKYIRLEIMDQFSDDIFRSVDINFGDKGSRKPTNADNQIKCGDNSISFRDINIPNVFVQNNKMVFRISCHQ